MKQRGSFAISTLILEATKNRLLTTTRIIQELVLNHDRTTRYTRMLLEDCLLHYD